MFQQRRTFLSIFTADEIVVSAAASLTDVLKEITAGYQAKAKHTVRFNFGPSSALARQIEEGAPADLFFSAGPAHQAIRMHSDTV